MADRGGEITEPVVSQQKDTMSKPVAAVPVGAPVQGVPAGASPINGSCCAYCCDSSICCAVYFCPCCVIGAISEGLTTGKLPDPCTGGLNSGCLAAIFSAIHLPFTNRQAIRNIYDLEVDYCGDCFCYCCCPACNLCVDYKELEMRLPAK